MLGVWGSRFGVTGLQEWALAFHPRSPRNAMMRLISEVRLLLAEGLFRLIIMTERHGMCTIIYIYTHTYLYNYAHMYLFVGV